MVGGSPGATALAIILLLATFANAGPINRKWQKRSVGDFNSTDSIFSQGVGGECVTEHGVYHGGESVPSPGPCETCTCRPPTVFCSMVRCPINPGCRTIQRSNQCCPDYRCECEHDGKTYNNGEKIVMPDQPCQVCYCKGGEVMCTSITCYQRDDCQPTYIPGQCCPKYDHCPPLDSSDKKSSDSSGTSVKTSRSSNSGGYKREMQPWLLTQSANKDHTSEHTRAYHAATPIDTQATPTDLQATPTDLQAMPPLADKRPNTVIFTEMTAEEVKTKLKSDADAYESARSKGEKVSGGKVGGVDGEEKGGNDVKGDKNGGKEDGSEVSVEKNDGGKEGSVNESETRGANEESNKDGLVENVDKEGGNGNEKDESVDGNTDGNDKNVVLVNEESTDKIEENTGTKVMDEFTDNIESTTDGYGETTYITTNDHKESTTDFSTVVDPEISDKTIIDESTNPIDLEDNFILNDASTLYNVVPQDNTESTLGSRGFTTVGEDEATTGSPDLMEFISTGVTDNQDMGQFRDYVSDGLEVNEFSTRGLEDEVSTEGPTSEVGVGEEKSGVATTEGTLTTIHPTSTTTESSLNTLEPTVGAHVVSEDDKLGKQVVEDEHLEKETSETKSPNRAENVGEGTKSSTEESLDREVTSFVTEIFGEDADETDREEKTKRTLLPERLDRKYTTAIHPSQVAHYIDEKTKLDDFRQHNENMDKSRNNEVTETKYGIIKSVFISNKDMDSLTEDVNGNLDGMGTTGLSTLDIEQNDGERVSTEKISSSDEVEAGKDVEVITSDVESMEDDGTKQGTKDSLIKKCDPKKKQPKAIGSSSKKNDIGVGEKNKMKKDVVEGKGAVGGKGIEGEEMHKEELMKEKEVKVGNNNSSEDSSSSSSSSSSDDSKPESKSKDDSSDSSSSSSSSESDDSKSKTKSKDDSSSSSSSSSESDDSKQKSKDDSSDSSSSSSSSSSESDESKSKTKSKSDSSSSSSSESDDSKSKHKSKDDSSESSSNSSSSSSESDDSKSKDDSSDSSSSSSSSSSESDDSKSKSKSKDDSSDSSSSSSSSSSESDDSNSKSKSKDDSSDSSSSSSSSSSESDESKSKTKSKSDSSSSSNSDSDDSKSKDESKKDSSDSSSSSSSSSSESDDSKSKDDSSDSSSSSSSSSSSESDDSKSKSKSKDDSSSSSSSESNDSKSKDNSKDDSSSSSSSSSDSDDSKSKSKSKSDSSDSSSSSSSSSSESDDSKSKSDSSSSSSSSESTEEKSKDTSNDDSSSSSSSSESDDSKSKSKSKDDSSSSSSSDSDDSKSKSKSKDDSSDSSSSSSSSSSESDDSKSKDKSKADSSDSSSSSSSSSSSESDESKSKTKLKSDSSDSSSSSSSSESDDSKSKDKSKSDSSDSSSSSSSSSSESKSKDKSKDDSSSSSESESKSKSKSGSSDSSSSSSSSESKNSKSEDKSKSESSSSSESSESSESKEESKKSKSDSSEESSESDNSKSKSKSKSDSSDSSSSSESDESKEGKSVRKSKSDSSSSSSSSESSESKSKTKSKSDSSDSSISSSSSESDDSKSKGKSESSSSSSSSESDDKKSKDKSDSDSKSHSKSDSDSSDSSSSSSSESNDSKSQRKSKSDSSESSSSSSSESTEEKSGDELKSTGNKSKNDSSSDSSSSSSSSESDEKDVKTNVEMTTDSSIVVDSKHETPHEKKDGLGDGGKEGVVDGSSKKDENDHSIVETNQKGKTNIGKRKHKMTSNLIKEKDDLKNGQDHMNEDDVIVLDITNNNKETDNMKTGEPTTFHLDLFNLNDDEDDEVGEAGDSGKTRKGSSKQSQRPMIKVMVQNRKNLNISNSQIILTPADLKLLAEYLINEKIKPAGQNHEDDDKEASKTNSIITKSLINNGDLTMVLNITTMSDVGVSKDVTTEVNTVTEGFDQNEVETFKPSDLMKDDKKSDRVVVDEVDCGDAASTASSTTVGGGKGETKEGVTEEPCDEEGGEELTEAEVGTTDRFPESTEFPDVHTTLSDDQILKGLIDLMRKTTELTDEESTTIYTHNVNSETSTETVEKRPESTTRRKSTTDAAKNENNDETSSRKVKITDNEAGKESYTATLDDKDLHLLRDFMKKHLNIK